MLKWLKRLGVGIAGLLVLGAILRFGFGLHFYMDGSFRPHYAFGSTSAHYDALERQREAQKASGPAPAIADPAPTPTSPAPAAVAPATAPATVAAGGTAPASPAALATAGSWSEYRGPGRDGVYRQRPLAATWPADGPKRLWTQPVGEGHASFAIARGVAYTIEQRRGREVVAAYDVKTGREIWTNAWDTLFSEAMGGDGPRATPTYVAGTLYALGAAGELRAITAATGATVWRANILDDAGSSNLQWAMAGSPLVVDGKVIVQPGGRGTSVVAYDATSGKVVWKALDDSQAYVSPMLATLAGRRQIVTLTGQRAVGVAIEDGTLLWSARWGNENDIIAAQPVVVGPNRVFVSSGYQKGGALLEIEPAGAGQSARVVWETQRMKNKLSSSVLHDGYIYGLDEGILACIDASTGQQAWKGGRYGHGQLILAGDRLVITTETGELALVKATPAAHEELARVAGIDGRTWNVPAIDDGILLVRNAREMAAFDLR
jgi:outer membrane protein assembly factor BamB